MRETAIWTGCQPSLRVCLRRDLWIRYTPIPCFPPMLFTAKTAGKWIASKNGKLVDSSKSLDRLMKKVAPRKDRRALRFDRVPEQQFFAGLSPHAV
jgi:hypothetical protein